MSCTSAVGQRCFLVEKASSTRYFKVSGHFLRKGAEGVSVSRLHSVLALMFLTLEPDVSGLPGTGKTATVHAVIRQLKRMAEENVSRDAISMSVC